MNFYSLAEKRSAFFCSVVLFRLILEVGYITYVSPRFGYSGFILDWNELKYFESWLLTLLVFSVIPWRLERVSDYLMVTTFLGLIIPLLSLYGLANHERWIVYAVLGQFSLVVIFRKGRKVHIPSMKQGRFFAVTLLFALVVSLSAWYVLSGGIRYMNFDLARVYEFRRDAGAVVAPGLLSYVNRWIWKVFGPLLLAVALWKRWWVVAFAVVASHAFWFSVSNHKAVLFYPVIIFGMWYWFQRSRGLTILPVGFSVVVLSVLSYYLLTGDGFPASLFIRRVFYVIANNTFDYYYFFSANAKVWWANSSVTLGLLDPVYELGPAKTIGQWRGTDSHVNNSFLSTGYMHGGWFGMVIYGVLAGLLFRLIDSMARGPLPLWVALAAVVIPARSLVLSADLPAALLTHGIGVGIVMLWLLNSGVVQHRLAARESAVSVPR